MSFPEKLQAVFDKYGTTELKIYTLLNLYDDVLVVYAEHEKEDVEKSEGYAKVCARLHEHIMDMEKVERERKQKLQQLQEELPISYSWLEKFEVYDLGTKSDWKKWLKKFEELKE